MENEPNHHPVLKTRGQLTLGQRAADRLTTVMGSWGFILMFVGYILLWITLNIIAWEQNWDPYPFILLNLTLSCLAALQAPIILMSQNRQAQRDRAMAKYDYDVDRKAEREVRKIQEELEEIKKLLQEKK